MSWILNQPDTRNKPNSFCIVVVVGFSNFIKTISYNLYLTSQSIPIMLGANFGKELIFVRVIEDLVFKFFDKFIFKCNFGNLYIFIRETRH